jgi:hypothetical protein
MVSVHLDNSNSVGLGDNVCLLSALANIPEQVDLYTTNDHNTFDRLTQLKKIFNIADSNIRIILSDTNGDFHNSGWPLKLFTEYYRPTHVKIHNKLQPARPYKDRPCVAIAGFFDTVPDNSNNEWPWCKQRPLEYWARVFLWLKSMDYEVVTVDRHQFCLDDKIDLLVNKCKAIISYEGGMAHLSHMLRVPCFLIDWKLPSPSTTLGEFHCEFVHRTKNVYIVRNDEELFGWDRNAFESKVFDLTKEISNNRLVNNECIVSFANDKLYGNITIFKHSKETVAIPNILGRTATTDFLSKYYSLK